MKNATQLMAVVDDIAPDLKASERLSLVGLVLDEQKAAFQEAAKRAIDTVTYSNKDDSSPLFSNPYMEG